MAGQGQPLASPTSPHGAQEANSVSIPVAGGGTIDLMQLSSKDLGLDGDPNKAKKRSVRLLAKRFESTGSMSASSPSSILPQKNPNVFKDKDGHGSTSALSGSGGGLGSASSGLSGSGGSAVGGSSSSSASSGEQTGHLPATLTNSVP
jgi:hypothetical protein